MIIFDTSILIDIERKHSPTIIYLRQFLKNRLEKPAIAFPSLSEFTYGLLKRGRSLHKISSSLSSYSVLHSSTKSALLSAKLKFLLEKKGKRIGDLDLLIASVALIAKGTLVTKDKDFENVPLLKCVVLD